MKQIFLAVLAALVLTGCAAAPGDNRTIFERCMEQWFCFDPPMQK